MTDQAVARLFERALALPRSARDAFLADACSSEPALREELRSLLRAYDASEGWLEGLADRLVVPALTSLAGAPRVASFAAGERIAHYEITERVAAGGMGIVYCARDVRLDRRVALKFLLHRPGTDVAARDRMIAEARAASAIDHPNIAVVHDIAETAEGALFIAMAWYDGETLKSRLAQAPLPIGAVVDIAGQVAAALDAAHRGGVVHRDVKPANVLITTDGTAKLLDFGIARFTRTSSTLEMLTAGTPLYMSPEQTRGEAADHRVDIWALGVLLYEMLTGVTPFSGADDAAVIDAIRHADPAPLAALRADAPPELAALVQACLLKDAEQRPDRAADVLAVLKALPGAAGAVTGQQPRLRSRQARRIAAAAAALVVIVAATAYLTRRPVAATTTAQRIAVVPFHNQSGRAELAGVGAMAADWIIEGLSRTGLVDVVPMAAMLAEPPAPNAAGAGSIEAAVHVARGVGAGHVVSGSYYQQRDSLYLHATVTDVSNGRLLNAIEPIATRPDAPLDGIERVRERVLSVLGPHLFPAHDYAAVVSTPPTFEAYRAFMAGLERFIAHDLRGAIDLFAEASAHDSTFALPQVHAAVAMSLLGHFAGIDSILAVVRPRLHRMGEVERLGFEMLEARVRGDHAAFHRASLRAPDVARGTALPWMFTITAVWVNRPYEAVRIARALDAERGTQRRWFMYWRNYTTALHMIGAHREELRVARRARALFPGELRFVSLEVQALAALGRADEIRALIDRGSNAPPDPPALRVVALELLAHGSEAAGRALLRRSTEWPEAQPAAPRARAFRAETHYFLDELDEAERLIRALAADHADLPEVQGLLGLLAARRGDAAEAAERDAALAAMQRPYLHGNNTYWRARIAAVLGRSDEAVRLLREAYREGYLIWTPAHIEPDFAGLRRQRVFRELLRPHG